MLQTDFNETTLVVSPSGRWMAYTSNESGRNEVYVKPFPDPGRKWQISTDGGRDLVWSPSGRELFFRNGQNIMAVDVETEPEFRAAAPRFLFEGTYLNDFGRDYDIAPDGKSFVMIQPGEAAAGSAREQIDVVLNWHQELERRVPVNWPRMRLMETNGYKESSWKRADSRSRPFKLVRSFWIVKPPSGKRAT